MRSLLPCLAILALASNGTAHGQASRFGATPAEYRAASVKLAALEGDFVSLSRRYGVPMPTLRAIARGQARAAPSFGTDKLRETMSKMAKEAAGLRQQMATLKAKVSLLETKSGTRSDGALEALSAELANASVLLDDGDLDGAGRILDRIKTGAAATKAGGARIWTDIVKVEAKLKYLSGDIQGFEDTLVAARTALLTDDRTLLIWELEQERGEGLTEYGEDQQDVIQIARAANILQNSALPLALKLENRQALQTLTFLCRASLSPFFEMTTGENLSERFLPEMRKLLTFCGLADGLAAQTPDAPDALKARAKVQYGFVLAFMYAVGVGDENRAEAISRADQALALIEANSSGAETAAVYMAAGDVYSTLYAAKNVRSLMVRSINLTERAMRTVNKASNPSLWASAHLRVGGNYWSLYQQEGKENDLLQAVKNFGEAAGVFTRTFSELAWARTLASLGAARGFLGIANRNKASVAASVDDLKVAETVLISSLSQRVREGAVRNRGILEAWLAAN